jgi:hypothetical protein
MNRPPILPPVHDITNRCMTSPSNGGPTRVLRGRGSGRLSAPRHRGPGEWVAELATAGIIRIRRRQASQQQRCRRAR